MIVIAHRGASAEAPENTLAAFERAIAIGADMIELDLCASSDGVVYVAHDPPLVPGLPRLLAPALEWARIRERAGSDGRYPRLADVLDLVAGRIALNLEIKQRRVVPLLLGELERRGDVPDLLVSSFDRATMRALAAARPGLGRALLARRMPLRLREAARSLGVRTLHPHVSAVRAPLLRVARRLGLPVYAWTVDAPEEIRRLRALGVDGVFTNDPRRALAVLGRGR